MLEDCNRVNRFMKYSECKYIGVSVKYHYKGGCCEYLRIYQIGAINENQYAVVNDYCEIMIDNVSFSEAIDFYHDLIEGRYE